MSRPKVFGIGFHKTATTSLAGALGILGYRVTGPNAITRSDVEARAFRAARRLVRRYDAFQDNPWPLLYRELDEMCPGSKFILTVRPADRWIRSVVDHFGADSTPMRDWIYDGVGSPLGNEEHYLERYERHNRDVRRYFADRPADLLEMDITAGDGWEPLCAFLGHPIPQVPFPTMNSKDDTARNRGFASRVLHLARRLIPGGHGYSGLPGD
ncbi:MAG: hypothetical protein OEM97_05410 [Acidimicrobiia bacterium]|nr:hypothetical protein [Acidimicrobiia bacterium]